MKKCIQSMILWILIALAVPCSAVYAYTPCVHIRVYYSSFLEPSEGDFFEITYKMEGKEDCATITLDASSIRGHVGKLDIDPGIYEIVDVSYQGENLSIEDYAVNQVFEVLEDESSYAELVLGIGKEEAQKVVNTYQYYIAKSGEHFVRTYEDRVSVDLNEIPLESDMVETKSDFISAEQTAYENIEETSQEADSVDIEHFDDNHKESDLRILKKGLPVLVFAAIGTIILFVIKRKGFV